MAYERYARGTPTFDDLDDRDSPFGDPTASSDADGVPDVVKTFVAFLYRNIRENNVFEIHQMYESSFHKLSDRLFSESPWPTAEAIAPVVDNDPVFCLLYRELYFRHVFARLQPTLEQRCESWENYCNLFQVVLHGQLNVQLPNAWLWDMVDEFAYQFGAFCQFRARAKSRTEEEIAQLKQCGNVWNAYGVLNYLHALVHKSGILQTLDDDADDGAAAHFLLTEGYDMTGGGGSNVLQMLGYFSIVGLTRVHCLLGDYHTALVKLSAIDVGRPGVYQRIIGCHVSVMYYYGFASLMLRRYVDAIRAFNSVLVAIGKARQFLEGSPALEQTLKKNEQVFVLLAVCLALCPNAKMVDETVNTQLRDKLSDKIQRMQRGDEAVFDELFSFACPKFVTPAPPNFDEPLVNTNQDAYRLQLKLFLADVRSQMALPGLRSALALYSAISLPRLSTFLDVSETTLRTALMTLRHKNTVVEADGTVLPNAELDFFIDDDMVQVVQRKTTRRFGDYFIRHVLKFDEIVAELENVQLD
eukprot:TRINITY_DN8253_c0_g1_i1.p1 TRINITY_DN8253_c0_g1~~TRINITY_DN8253_c0_g1_i1.p1  ORF type:complete len:528 (+),score=41.84 TRINITY_DN8253_c0_g1_i1:206-1789(+)